MNIKHLLLISSLILPCGLNADTLHLSFKDSSMVNDTVIKLSDIASIEYTGSGDRDKISEFVVGDAAPAGYSRFINRDDLLTNTLRSSFKSMNITSSGATRTSISTDFVTKKVSDLSAEIETFLKQELAWPKGTWEFSIINEAETFKIIDKPFTVQYTGLMTKFPRGRFNFQIKVLQGSKCIRVSVNGDLKVVLPVVVATSVINRGQLINNTECELRSTDITHLGLIPYDSLSEVVGKKAMRLITPGLIINKQWVETIADIEKGDPVTIVARKSTVRVAVNAIARESGMIGEKMWVENSESHRLVRVIVKSKGVVTTL